MPSRLKRNKSKRKNNPQTSPKKILLTGKPKSGKSYLLKKLIEYMHKHNIDASGFTTDELAFAGTRVGITVDPILDQSSHLFAIKEFKSDKLKFSTLPRTGNYIVDIDVF